jgi:hypothetical protein
MLIIDKIQKDIRLYNRFQKVLKIQHILAGMFLCDDIQADSKCD